MLDTLQWQGKTLSVLSDNQVRRLSAKKYLKSMTLGVVVAQVVANRTTDVSKG